MKLSKYFDVHKDIDFGKLLLKYKKLFKSDDFEREHMDVQTEIDCIKDAYTPHFKTKINVKLAEIAKSNVACFIKFIMSEDFLQQYSNCRNLKEINMKKITEKAVNNEKDNHTFNPDDFKDKVNFVSDKVITNLENNWSNYYAISKTFTNSSLDNVPPEVIGKIGHYIDGNIEL